MRWKGRRESENVEDRRQVTPAEIAVGGGIGTIILVLVALFLGADPRALMQQVQRQQQQQQQQAPAGGGPKGPVDPAEEERAQFVKVVLADTEDVWNEVFQQMRKQYEEPKLVLFSRRVESACGYASAAVGPFYCPGDHKVYLDLAFFNQMKEQFGAPGEFAQAYVVAHEVGHHVQNLLGISDMVHEKKRQLSEAEFNKLSVRLELQADFLAGVWANKADRAKQMLEAGDVRAALTAATAIGDDTLQRESQGYVRPDAFTHGTSDQRVKWFSLGLKTGDLRKGDALFELPYDEL